MVTKKGPSKEEMDNDFTFTVIGKGWDKSAAKIDGEYINPPNKKAILKVQIQRSIMTYREYSSSLVIQLVRYKLLHCGCQVRGKNPGYGGTVTIMLQCGLSIIKERDLMPSK
jgi:hypothetical protein